MKVIHIVLGTADPSTLNGVNRVIYTLATHMHHLGQSVEVWAIDDTGAIDYPRQFTLRAFPPHWGRFTLSRSLRQALAALPAQTLVHFHSVFIPEFFAIARVLRRRGIPWVLTPHSGYSTLRVGGRHPVKQAYFNLFERYIIHHARAIHVLGPIEADDLLRWGVPVVYIPNGQELLPMPGSPRPGQEDRPIFCYCGRLAIRQKGLDLMLQGFGAYLRAGGQGELWLIGDGNDRPRLQALASELGIAAQTRFWGAKFGEEKLALLHAASLFLHTSRWEGLPMAVLEAASLSLPLLVSRETNMDQYVRDFEAGWVLASNTPPDISEALRTAEDLHRQGRLARLGENGYRMIASAFDWAHITHRMCRELYQA